MVSHTVVDVRTVVVKLPDTPVTVAAVLCAQWLYGATRVTQLLERVVALLPFIKVCNLHETKINMKDMHK